MARKKVTVSVIGAGVVGRSVARVLRENGYSIAAVASRSSASVQEAVDFIGAGRAARSLSAAARSGDLVLITTSDGAIRRVCEQIAERKGFKRGSTVLHFSGALSSSELAAARERKAHVASLHPMQSFPSAEEALKRFRGTVFTFEGDPEAEPVAAKLVDALAGKMVAMEASSKALYHAACCVISNYAVSIVDFGLALLELSGFSRKDAQKAVMPLLKGTVKNLGDIGSPAALTGPIARGDSATIEQHLEALRPLPRDIRRLYCEIGLYTLRVAQRKGRLDPTQGRHLWHLLSRAGR
jgi:predicted short-subunit dehydrogenase-like oxidoreductase (DUF2520 family)